MDPKEQLDAVSKYYGETLATSSDLRTSACCPIDSVPAAHQRILKMMHPDILSRFYGCGSPIPTHLTGASVLDLGCGTGRDAYLASALVGPTGSVVGVDMTDSQLDVARSHIQFHADKLLGPGSKTNVSFRKGFIEDLTSADVQPDSFDVVISNCVCNLSPDKRAVFAGVYSALSNGGEFYFSDVYASCRLSEAARKDEVLVAECLGGALYVEDFRRVMAEVGFADVRIMSAAPVVLQDAELLKLVPNVKFYSLTIRAFKMDGLEDRREDFGQTATYSPRDGDEDGDFRLDIDNIFTPGIAKTVDANTAAILSASRFKSRFVVTSPGPHRGIFRQSVGARAAGDVLDGFRPYIAPVSSDWALAEVKGAPMVCGPAKSSGCGPSSGTAASGCCAPPPKAAASGGCPPAPSPAAANDTASSPASTSNGCQPKPRANTASTGCCSP